MKSVSIILILFCSIAAAKDREDCVLLNKQSGKQFRIFNAFLYQNLPNLSELCIEPINVMYAWEFFPRGPSKGNHDLPSSEAMARAISKIRDQGIITAIDVEHWPLKAAPIEKLLKSADNYVSLAKSIHEQTRNIPFGYYGVLPVVEFSRAIASPESQRYKSWQADNDRVKTVSETVNAFFPSLYTINPDRNKWILRAQSHLKELQRIAPDKPIYPFIWPDYHEQGGKYPEGAQIPGDYWRLQLDYLKDHADGLVLWGGYKQAFATDMAWWQELNRFIHSNFDQVPPTF